MADPNPATYNDGDRKDAINSTIPFITNVNNPSVRIVTGNAKNDMIGFIIILTIPIIADAQRAPEKPVI